MRPDDFSPVERLLLRGAVTSRIREVVAFHETCWASSDELREALVKERRRLEALARMLADKERGR